MDRMKFCLEQAESALELAEAADNFSAFMSYRDRAQAFLREAHALQIAHAHRHRWPASRPVERHRPIITVEVGGTVDVEASSERPAAPVLVAPK